MVDIKSIMQETTPELNARIALRVLELRTALGLTLDALASRSGVSRSMISLIERGESSPTAVVLDKLATALDVPLASLFDSPAEPMAASGPIARRADQAEWIDPASGYRRRNVSPPAVKQPMKIVDVEFPARARVAFETSGGEARVHQQVWVFEGSIEISQGGIVHRLGPGDCLAMQLDSPVMFHNPTRQLARYAVVVASETGARR
ncbi:XRE family transcriptional regulator [soil metagenome]